MPGVIVIGSLVIAVTIGFMFVFGTPILGVPIAIVGLGAIGAVEVMRRQRDLTNIRRFREQAASQKTEFTARDRETQVSEDRL